MRKNYEINGNFKTQNKRQIFVPNTFKTRWPDGRGVNVLSLCQYNKHHTLDHVYE